MATFIRWLIFATNLMTLVTLISAGHEESYVRADKKKYEERINAMEKNSYDEPENDNCSIQPCATDRTIIKIPKKVQKTTEQKPNRIKRCNEGYIPKENKCVPYCSEGCHHGKCVAPDTCNCDNGYRGYSCDIACPRGYWGPNCVNICKCINGGICDSINGSCNCTKGWTGEQCQRQCSTDRYGENCAELCRCNNGGSCDRVSGECYCAAGFTGPVCDDSCPVGTYGEDCKMKCKCQNGGLCNSTTGDCSCKHGWIGRVCAYRCPDGYWGKKCKEKCDCHNGSSCHHVTGKCTCLPGYRGKQCLRHCPKDKYGVNCRRNCRCKNNGTCSPIDGNCRCNDGWQGENCEKRKCPDNLSGGNCSRICENEDCIDDTFGEDCTLKCSCENGATCSIEYGRCKCTGGENNDVKFQLKNCLQQPEFIYGSAIAGILAMTIVIAILSAAFMCRHRKITNLKMDIAQEQFIDESVTSHDRNQFDNPVYSHEGDNRADDNSTTLLNNGLIRNNLGMKNVKNERSKLSPDSCTNEGDDSCKGVCGVRCDDRATSSKNKDGGSSKSIENLYQSIDEINRGKIGDDIYVEMKPSKSI